MLHYFMNNYLLIYLITTYLTDMLMQHGNIVQYDQMAGPYTFDHFTTISSEHKPILLLVEGPRDCHLTNSNII